jgi:quercetin dioxygenase-like cupin family protein/DNA-binding XRE family transcriptional regulator
MKKKAAKSTLTNENKRVPRSNRAESEDFLTSPTHTRPLITGGLAKNTLGQRIKTVREARGLTLKDISSRIGINEKTLKLIESDDFAPPLGQLIKLGKALDTQMGYFISPGVDKPMTVVRRSQRRPIARHGESRSAIFGYTYEALAPEKANRAMEPFIVTLIPTNTDDTSIHDGQEFIFVLEGKVKVQVGALVELLSPGDAVYYDSNLPHVVKAGNKQKATILAVIYTELNKSVKNKANNT